jgi:hypothetical protein
MDGVEVGGEVEERIAAAAGRILTADPSLQPRKLVSTNSIQGKKEWNCCCC